MINVENLRKEFKSNKVDPGFKGAVKSLFSHETISKVAVDGLIPYENRIENAKKIGVVFGQRTQLWWDLPLSETFELLKKIYCLEEKQYKQRFDLLREGLGLDEFMSSTVRTLSLGQRMRADLAAALIHNPKVIYLDEPTIGLDIVVKDQIRDLIRSFKEEYNTTVMLTTHDMSDIEELCKRILVIDKGNLIFDGDIKTLKDTYGTSRTLELTLKDVASFNLDLLKSQIGDINQQLIFDCEGNRLSIGQNKENIDTVELIAHIVKYVGVKDIQIQDMPISDIIKKIYMGESLK